MNWYALEIDYKETRYMRAHSAADAVTCFAVEQTMHTYYSRATLTRIYCVDKPPEGYLPVAISSSK